MWKNRLIYILLAAYSCLFVVLYQGYTAFLAASIVLLLPFGMACIMRLLICPNIEVSLQEHEGYLNQEEPAEIILKLKNNSILPILYATAYVQLFYEHGDKKECQKVKVCANAKAQDEVELAIVPRHCGLVNVKISKVKIYDYFRIYAMSRKDFGEIALPVWPKKIELEETESKILTQKMEDSERFSKDKPGDDPSEIFDIRTYREGDRLQRIHWKLSSKKNQILVKEYSLPLVEQIVLFVVLDWENRETADVVMQKMVCVLEKLLQMEKHVLVYWYTEKGYCRQEILKREEIVMLLQQIYESSFSEKEYGREALLECLKQEGVEDGYIISKNGIEKVL